MATPQTKVESPLRNLKQVPPFQEPDTVCLETLIELSAQSFDTFCDDISGMFGANTDCNQQQVCTETSEGLKKGFGKLVLLNSVKAEGSLDGTFQLVFDNEGLFTLAGVILLQPQEMILKNRKLDSVKKARELSEVLVELGDTLVGSWDRVFRKGLDGHHRFVRTNTFIGNPWDKPDEKIGLASDEELVFVGYEMTIAPYPAFKCGVIFPKTVFAGKPVSVPEQTAAAKETIQEEIGQETQDQEPAVEEAEPEEADTEESDTAQKSDSDECKPQEPAAKKADAEETPAKEDAEEATIAREEATAAEQAKPGIEEASDADREAEAAGQKSSDGVDADASDNTVEEKATTTETDKGEGEPVSETIQEMAQSSAVLQGESPVSAPTEKLTLSSTGTLLATLTKDIMQKDVLWGSPDDSVQQALTKMQQHNSEYMMIGHDGVLEGTVSKSELTGAVSPYLRPAFAKWRRPLDDATLQIKIKWIMSKPVHTIRLETPLATIMENMCRSGRSVLPVTDQQSKVQGFITVFDIFEALLKSKQDILAEAKTPEASTSA